MKFLCESRGAAAKAVSAQLSERISAKKPVIWLVCGGSNIATEVEIMKLVREACGDSLGNLLILPMDERFGLAGHPDSNYRQMKDAGFEPGSAMWLDILANNLPLQETVDRFSKLIQAAVKVTSEIIGVFGLGGDGHIAGILPNSPAILESSPDVIGYEAPPLTRITMGPSLIVKVSTAYVLAYGESKKESLNRLKANKESVAKLPAKLLYGVSNTYVYNDQLCKESNAGTKRRVVKGSKRRKT